MAKDLISIIVPIYKVEKYLERCVKTIELQTYDNIEIILVDDGSPDSCPEICDRLGKQDNRIKVIHQDNGGLSDARNRGLSDAKGQYVLFVDSDDYLDKHMVEMLYLAIINNDADIAVCDFEYVDAKGVIIESDKKDMADLLINQHEYWTGYFNGHSIQYVVAWNKLYRRSLFDEIRYPKNKINEDEFIIHELIDKCRKIVTIPDKLYYYVQRDNSIMNTENIIGRLDGIEAKLRRVEYFSRVNEGGFAQMLLTQEVYPVSSLFDRLRKGGAKDRVFEIHSMFKEAYLSINKDAFIGKNKERKNAWLLSYYPLVYVWIVHVFNFMCKKIENSVVNKLSRMVLYVIKNKSRIKNADYILIDTPVHGNLGDQAIALAEEQIIKRYIGNNYVEITAYEYGRYKRVFPFLISSKQTLLVHGGGFLGTLWIDEEQRFRDIINTFKNNRVIVFPQTVTFDLGTEYGKTCLENSSKIYSAHRKLTIFVREKKSYDFLKQYMPSVKTILVPDVVLLMEVGKVQEKKTRSGVILCMRHDKEKRVTKEELYCIIDKLKEHYPYEKLQYTDTVVNYNIPVSKRRNEVQKKLDQFCSAKLIITDRLHGMIFAAITNTPCIALGNINDKVKGVYEWIDKNDFIKYIGSIDQFENVIYKLNVNKEYIYSEHSLYEKMIPLFLELERKSE